MKRFLVTVAMAAVSGAAFLSIAGEKTVLGSDGGAQTTTVSLTAKQRGNIARTLVNMWAADVRAQGRDVDAWALRLGRFVGTADTANLRQALDMPTYAAMMGALEGRSRGIGSVQKLTTRTAASGEKSLGNTIADTTYTPLPNGRCRIADSRVIASPLPGGVSRAIDSEDIVSYASQGGNGTFANGDGSTNCGIPSFATAVAVSVTVLSTGGEGIFKIYENGKAYQTGSTVYYTGVVSAANDMIVTSCQACAIELAIYSSSSVHYVIDVVGYFIPPQATALQCVESAEATTPAPGVLPGGTRNETAPSCPAGYTQTATNCETTSWLMPIVYFKAGTCSARNNDVSNQFISASRTCCRVPGR